MAPRESHPPTEIDSLAQEEGYQMLEFLTSDVVFDQEKEHLTGLIHGDSEVKLYGELEEAELAATRKMYHEAREGNPIASKEQENLTNHFEQEKSLLPKGTGERYRALKDKLDALRKRHQRIVESEEFEAQKILELLDNAQAIQPEPMDQAPFADYVDNTEESWRHVADDTVRQYMSNFQFVDTDVPRIQKDGARNIIIKTSPGESIDIPLNIIVSAAGLDSWLGREGYGSGKDVRGRYSKLYDRKIPSLDVVKHYASLPSELPSVSGINLYIQPDGVIFADNGEGDSHRIAAAMLRGQKTIKADQITIRCVDQNFIKPAEGRGV